jgi:hypothetical protein
MRSQFAVILAVTGLLWLPAGSGAQQDPQVQEQTTAKAPSEAPAALEQIPSGKFIVLYRNGELTIHVRNAPLIDVLRAVCSQIGAALDLTSGADEPIFADLGPGPPKKVIASLLEGAPYNYVMARSADDQNSVINLVVFPMTKYSDVDNQINQPLRPRRAASIGEKPLPQKASEPPTQAMASLSATENSDVGDRNVADMAPDSKLAEQFRELEAQIRAAVEPSSDTVSSQNALQTPTVDPSGLDPPGRPRHRRR